MAGAAIERAAAATRRRGLRADVARRLLPGGSRPARAGARRWATGSPWARGSVARSPRGRPRCTSGPWGSAATAGVVALLALARDAEHPPLPVLVALALLLAIPCSEVAITLINWIVMAMLPPRILTKLAFEKGIPASCRTLVVVPALIGSEDDVRELLEALEVRFARQPRGQPPLRAAHGLPRRRRRRAARRGRAARGGPARHRRAQRAPGDRARRTATSCSTAGGCGTP